jgi:putative flippase GtrA
MAEDRRGWRADPLGIHELRYFSLDGKPTRLVSDAGKTSHDPPRPVSPDGAPGATPPWFGTVRPSAIPHRAAAGTTTAPHATTRSAPLAPARPRTWLEDPTGPLGPGHPAGTAPVRLVRDGDVEPPRDVPAPPFRRATGPGIPLEPPPEVPQSAPHPQRVSLRRLIRYGSVSTISTLTGLVLLGIFVGVLDLPAIWANVLAIAIGTIPSFELNRRWVWAQNGQRSILRQVVPYAAFSFTGLIVSTFAVHLASDATTHSTRLFHTGAVEFASIAAQGALWILQFVLCDRILFRSTTTTSDLHTETIEDPYSTPTGLLAWPGQPRDARTGGLQLVDAGSAT